MTIKAQTTAEPIGNHVVKGYVEGIAYDDRQLSEEEAREAAALAQESTNEEVSNMNYSPTSWQPTRKWLAARVTAFTGLAVLFAAHGWHFDEHTTIATITIVSESLISYLVPNQQTPGGVPEAHSH